MSSPSCPPWRSAALRSITQPTRRSFPASVGMGLLRIHRHARCCRWMPLVSAAHPSGAALTHPPNPRRRDQLSRAGKDRKMNIRMMSYIAFKSLRVYGGIYSPYRHTKWEEAYVPALGRLTYTLRAPSLEGEQGIYATTLGEVRLHMDEYCSMFLAAPDPDAETEIWTNGWRTTCAIVLGEVDSLHDAARLIVTSHQAGYPQIQEILRWARLMQVVPQEGLTARELVEKSIEVRRMIRAEAMGQYATVRRRTSERRVRVTWSTPIKVVEGGQMPVLGRFPPFYIEVGEDWPPLSSLCNP